MNLLCEVTYLDGVDATRQITQVDALLSRVYVDSLKLDAKQIIYAYGLAYPNL